MTLHELNTPTYGTISAAQGSLPHDAKITLTTKGPTDVWKKPGNPEVTTFNAPALYRKVALGKFKSVKVKVSAPFSTLYDQGGLLFVFPSSSSSSSQTGEEIGKSSRWIKTGIEFYNNRPLISTVVRDTWADWSLYPDGASTSADGDISVEILAERSDEDGSLWFYVIKGGEKLPIREVTWVGEESQKEGREVWIGVFAATPEGFGKPGLVGEAGVARKELTVKFEGWEWDVKE